MVGVRSVSVILLIAVLASAAESRTAKPSMTRAQGNLVALFSDEDYPAPSLYRGEQGTVGVVLSISPTGKVAKCDVILSASPELDARTCAVLSERAKFIPARDRRGRATTDTYSQRETWRMPDTEPFGAAAIIPITPSLDVSTEQTLIFEQGRLASCSTTFTPPLPDPNGPAAQTPCAMAASSTAYFLASRPKEIVEPFRVISRQAFQFGQAPSQTPAATALVFGAKFVMRLAIDANGSVVRCEIVAEGGVGMPQPLSVCEADRFRFEPRKPDEPAVYPYLMISQSLRYEPR